MRHEAATLLLADDDEDDRFLILEGLRESRVLNDVRIVTDGVEVLAYLRREGRWADPAESPRPALVLLDLNMPRMDGRQVLGELKADPALRRIPVVVLTTSRADEDVLRAYDLGANGYVAKPVRFGDLVEVLRGLGHFWLQIVELPPEGL